MKWSDLNVTHVEHTAIALAIQIATTIVACFLWGSIPAVFLLSALPGAFVFYGREHAQAERRLYDRLKAKDLSWGITIEAMAFWRWNADSQLDFLCPALACAVVGITLRVIMC